MSNSGKFKIVLIDTCQSAAFIDFAQATGTLADFGETNKIYMGWRPTIYTAGGILQSLFHSTRAIKLIWENLGFGQDISNALSNATASGGNGVAQALWGGDGLPDPDQFSQSSDDNFILLPGPFTQLQLINLD